MIRYVTAALLAMCVCASAQTVVGNSGQPQTTSGHVPFLIPGVALDAAGNPYTVHDWDEPHLDIIRWDPETGNPVWNSGHIFSDLIDCIAVEPDGSVAYVTGWDNSKGGPPYKVDLWKAKINSTPAAVVNFTTAGKEVVLTTGSTNPHIPLALNGQDLWLTEQNANQVVEIDKTTGNQVSSFSVANPFGIAIDSSGNLWIGTGTGVSVYSTSGTLLGTPITGLLDVDSLSIGGSTLYVADRGASAIKQYTLNGITATFAKSIGHPASPGENVDDAIRSLNSVATNAAGALIWSEHAYSNGYGGRLHSQGPTRCNIWSATCTEFQSCIAYSPVTKTLIGSYRDIYSTDSTGTKEQCWQGTGRTDYGNYFGKIFNSNFGTCRVVTLGGNDFYFFFCQGGNLAIYRVALTRSGWGAALQFAGALAFSTPGPDGSMSPSYQTLYQWSWNDTTGPGLSSVGPSTNLLNDPGTTVNWTANNPNNIWSIAAENVDDNGTIWIATQYRQLAGKTPEYQSVWAVPLHGINGAGNPIYLWSDAVEIVNNAALCTAVGVPVGNNKCDLESANFNPKDGQLYVLAYNPGGATRGGAWMAGNILIAFPEAGLNPVTTAAWAIPGQNCYVGLSPVPLATGGVLTGQNTGLPYGNGAVKRFDKNGNLIATYVPDSTFGTGGVNNPCGAFDTYGPINASLNPNGSLDVFSEDDFNGRGFWFNLPN